MKHRTCEVCGKVGHVGLDMVKFDRGRDYFVDYLHKACIPESMHCRRKRGSIWISPPPKTDELREGRYSKGGQDPYPSTPRPDVPLKPMSPDSLFNAYEVGITIKKGADALALDDAKKETK